MVEQPHRYVWDDHLYTRRANERRDTSLILPHPMYSQFHPSQWHDAVNQHLRSQRRQNLINNRRYTLWRIMRWIDLPRKRSVWRSRTNRTCLTFRPVKTCFSKSPWTIVSGALPMYAVNGGSSGITWLRGAPPPSRPFEYLNPSSNGLFQNLKWLRLHLPIVLIVATLILMMTSCISAVHSLW